MAGKRKRAYPDAMRKQARELRRAGLSYSEICTTLGLAVPRSTLNNWTKDIELTPKQRGRIEQKVHDSVLRSQPLAVARNKEQKLRRLEEIASKAVPIVERLVESEEALMLMASALYMGEGAKSEHQFCMGNSDPRIIRAWLALLRSTFQTDESKFRCQLAITEGMDVEALRAYWSATTGIPLSQFMKESVRKDSGGRRREGYRGVCIVHYYSLEVRRFLDAIGQGVIDRLLIEEG